MKQMESLLATGSIGRLIARFAIPSVISMLVNALYNMVDQIFIGRSVGYLGNGAANVVGLLTLVTLSLSLWMGDGAAAHFSLSLGAGRREEAARGAGTAISVVCAGSLLVTALCLAFLSPILRVFGCTDVLLPYAMEYGVLIALGLPFIMVSTTLNALIRADGSPRYAMAAMMLGAVVNACLDPLFLFGLGMGMRGAALSTLIGQAVTFALSAAYLRRWRSITLTRAMLRPTWNTLKSLAALGVSSLVNQLAFALVMAVNNNLLARYGARSPYGSEIPLTAYGIAMKVQEILFTLLMGIAIGMQPVVGYNYGAKLYGRVRRAYGLALAAGTALSAVAVVLFVCFPAPIIRLFGTAADPRYLAFSVKFFRTYFLLYLLFGFLTVTGVFSQSIGRSGAAAAVSLCYQLVFKIVGAVALCRFFGLDGVLWSEPLSDGLAAVLCGALVARELRRLRRLEAENR